MRYTGVILMFDTESVGSRPATKIANTHRESIDGGMADDRITAISKIAQDNETACVTKTLTFSEKFKSKR
jgi:hypothetical protein